MAPEALLWYKARELRPHDELDFAALLPVMAVEQRAWLQDAISVSDPAHPWLTRLVAQP